MAKDIKKDLQEFTVEEKLKSLYQLQLIFSEIDRIKTLRGELPLEVQDLEDEVAGLRTRIANYTVDIENVKLEENKRKAKIEEAKAMIEKYTEDQNNVRNNREYDLLAKEVEFQSLEVEFCEKKLRQYAAELKNKAEEIARTEIATDTPESLQRETADGLTLEGMLGTEAPEEAMVERIALRQAVDALPEKERTTILLRYFKGLTQQQTARILGVSQVQISRLERRGLQRLRESFLL
jgi:RNA polymerase sigma factor (sigma-70 family)